MFPTECAARVGSAYAPGSSTTCARPAGGHTAAPNASPDAATTLPLSIVPSDVMGSLAGASVPTALVTDTGSADAPASTRWLSPSTLSGSMTHVSASAITITRTRQSTAGDETTVPITTETLAYLPQPLPTATGAITLSIVSISADSSARAAASTKFSVLGGLDALSVSLGGTESRRPDVCAVLRAKRLTRPIDWHLGSLGVGFHRRLGVKGWGGRPRRCLRDVETTAWRWDQIALTVFHGGFQDSTNKRMHSLRDDGASRARRCKPPAPRKGWSGGEGSAHALCTIRAHRDLLAVGKKKRKKKRTRTTSTLDVAESNKLPEHVLYSAADMTIIASPETSYSAVRHAKLQCPETLERPSAHGHLAIRDSFHIVMIPKTAHKSKTGTALVGWGGGRKGEWLHPLLGGFF